jgi:hypothetical protein
MIKSNYSIKEKKEISNKIKKITLDDVKKDYDKLKSIECNEIKNGQIFGNDVIDYFTFYERLNTIGNKGISYYDFLLNIDLYKDKKYISNYIKYLDEKEKNNTQEKIFFRVCNLYFGFIGIFKPLLAKKIYCEYKPTSILDFTMGWGGRLVGACSLNIPNYIGIDLNKNLKNPYRNMVKFLNKNSTTNIKLYFEDAVKFDYSKLDYDFVLTSPPYYNIEIYNGTTKKSKEDWDNDFYIPLFTKTYKHMKNGHYCLNIPTYLYDVAIKVLGECNDKIPMTKAKRTVDEKYKEYIYIWKK